MVAGAVSTHALSVPRMIDESSQTVPGALLPAILPPAAPPAAVAFLAEDMASGQWSAIAICP